MIYLNSNLKIPFSAEPIQNKETKNAEKSFGAREQSKFYTE